jgi:phospholipid/cholesterol/gamma-HCH transport system permease protein
MAQEAAFDLLDEGRALALKGDWTVDTIAALEGELRALGERLQPGATLDVSALGRMDVAGAYLIGRTLRGAQADGMVRVRGEHPSARKLIETAGKSAKEPAPPPEHPHGLIGLVEIIGRNVGAIGEEIIETMSFFGETLAVLGRQLLNPTKIRWVSVVHTMEVAGLNAAPIIALLSFFIGLVVAYLGARILGDFGASVFTVELVAFSVMREFGVVITAVLLAGRTASAFTAEIGAMKMRQEIDAMRVMGLDPVETLVAPRVIAMVVMTPILTFAAMIAGLLGGLLACWAYLHVSPAMFFARLHDGVPAQHFWVGMSKAPVFALVLAVVGCRHGLLVEGDVGSLGRRVTSSVVEAISVIIALDAIFAVWFLQVNL